MDSQEPNQAHDEADYANRAQWLRAAVPLAAAGFMRRRDVRMGVVAAAVKAALVVFGSVGAVLGRTPVGRAGVRVLVGGWLAMAGTSSLVKLFGCSGL